MANPTSRPKAPFRGNARQRIAWLGDYLFVPGQRLSIELPRVGYLAGILVQMIGGLALTEGTATPTYKDTFANVLKRLSVNLNIGSALIFDVSGHGCNLLNQAMSFNYAMDQGGDGYNDNPAPLTLTADEDVGELPANLTTSATEPFTLSYYIPIAMNNGINFSIGLINLQAPEIRCTLDLVGGTLADFFDSVPATSFFTAATSYRVHYIYYEVPNPDFVAIPPYVVHRCLEDRQGIYANGDQVYTVPRAGTLQRVIQSVIINGNTNSRAVETLRIKINKTDEIYREHRQFNRWLSRMQYGHKMPRGAFYWDFWRAADVNAMGDYRDTIDTEQISTLEVIPSLYGDTVLGVGNNFLDTLREFTQKLTN